MINRRALLVLPLALASPAFAQKSAPRFDTPQAAVKRWYDPTVEDTQRPTTKKLATLYAAATKKAKQVKEALAGLDFDPLTGSQDSDDDYRKTLDFETRPVAAGVAIVEVRLRVFKGQPETKLFFDVVRENESWKVDDISKPGKDGWRWSQLLAAGAKGQ